MKIGLNHPGLAFVNLLCLDFVVTFQISKIQWINKSMHKDEAFDFNDEQMQKLLLHIGVHVTKFLYSYKLYYLNNKFKDFYYKW